MTTVYENMKPADAAPRILDRMDVNFAAGAVGADAAGDRGQRAGGDERGQRMR